MRLAFQDWTNPLVDIHSVTDFKEFHWFIYRLFKKDIQGNPPPDLKNVYKVNVSIPISFRLRGQKIHSQVCDSTS